MSTYNDASIIIPVSPGYKATEIYALKPTDSTGDLTFARTGIGSFRNSDGDNEVAATDVARFQYDVGDTCPYLLLERASTNLMGFSEDFTSGWTVSAGSSVVLTAIDNPVNGVNANLITIDSSGIWKNITTTPSFNCTGSFWLQKNSETGTITFTNAQGTGNGEWTIDLDVLDNGWNRIHKRHASVTVVANFVTTVGGDVAPRFTSATTKSVYVTGLDIELTDVYTSYIENVDATLNTRLVDTASAINSTALPTAFPFVVYANVYIEENLNGTVFSFLDSTASDVYFTVEFFTGTSKFVIEYRDGASDVQTASTDTFSTGFHKIAASFISNTEKSLYIDGSVQVDDTHTSQAFNASINDLLLGQLRIVADSGARNSIKAFEIYNNKLMTASELITLTTL